MRLGEDVPFRTTKACRHLLAKNGICPCGWVKPEEVARDEVPRPPAAALAFDLVGAKAERARRSLAWFVRESWHVLEPSTKLEWNWHVQAICDHVQAILAEWLRAKRDDDYVQQVLNAYFSLPPGVLKTRIIMECAPAWMWLHDPTWTVTCLSVNPVRARDSARNSRTIITSDWYQTWFGPEWRIRDDQDALGDFGNTAGGVRKSRGITAGIIGSRSDALLVDDPNSPDDDDDALRKVNELWDSTLFQRVNDLRRSVRIVVQQRVAPNDLTGHLREAGGWMGFVLPLLFDPERRCETPYGWVDPRTTEGEPLHPERFTLKVIQELRDRVLGPTLFQAQAQQDPDKNDGECFKVAWWNFWRPSTASAAQPQRPAGCRQEGAHVVEVDRWGRYAFDHVVVTVDGTGGSTAEDASHLGLLACATHGEKRFVLHDFAPGPRSFHQALNDLDLSIVKAAQLSGLKRVHVLIEKKALGPALIETIETHCKDGKYTIGDERIAVTVEAYEPPGTSKETRATAMEAPLVLGEIYLLDGASWLGAFVAEFKRFPKKPNDRVDALAQFVARYRKKLTWADAMKRAGGR